MFASLRRYRALFLPLIAFVGNAHSAEPAAPPRIDVLLQAATIYDGSGGKPTIGDVALRNGKIVGVGEFAVGRVDRTIDCRGLAVAPGFIDLHNHSDSPIVSSATRANINYLTQGCTSIVTGNCGFGPVDVAAYLAKVDEQGAGTNVLHLLPHGDLRDKVIGKEAREPTSAELAKMEKLAEQAMRDGAWGMSTGLIYVPGTYSKTEEIIAVAKVVGRHGGIYASHIRNEGVELLAAVEEALRIGREGDLPVHVSHFKASGRDAWGTLHIAAALIEKDREAGRRVTADQYPYTASSTSLEATLLPTWCREGGRKELIKRLLDAETRERIRKAIEEELAGKVRVQIAGYDPRRDWVGKSVDEIAALEKRPAADVVLEMEQNGGARVVNFGMHEDDMRMAMRLPWVATASDGSAKIPDADQPHPRSFGTFARKLGVYAVKENVVSLEQAIRSSSGLPADIIGLTDRGYLKAGLAADVVVFDPTQITDRATYDKPYEYSQGVRYVFVNGVPAIFEGTPTGALAGKALRRPHAKSAAVETTSEAKRLMSTIDSERQLTDFFRTHVRRPWNNVELQVFGDEGSTGYSGHIALPDGKRLDILNELSGQEMERFLRIVENWRAVSSAEQYGPFYCCNVIMRTDIAPQFKYYWERKPLTSLEMIAKDVHGSFHLTPFKHQLPEAVLRQYPKDEANMLCDVIDVYTSHQLLQKKKPSHFHMLVFAIGDWQADINNGGFNQYFSRRVGYGHAELKRSDLYLQVDEGLSTFDAKEARDLFRESIALYAHFYPEVEAARIALKIAAVQKQEESDVNSRFYIAEQRLREQLSDYIRANIEQFATTK